MSKVTGLGLSNVPFLNSCDSTRLQMVQKYYTQCIPSKNNDVPYLLGTDFYKLSGLSDKYIKYADEKGHVVYTNDDIIVVFYEESESFVCYYAPKYLKLSNMFVTELMFKLKDGDEFNKDDIIYEYAGFKNSIPTGGYNARVAFLPLMLKNYEDSLIISESFANRVRYTEIQEIIVPINVNDSLTMTSLDKYIPDVGDEFSYNETVISVASISNTFNALNVSRFFMGIPNDVTDTSYTCKLHKGKVVDIQVFKKSRIKEVNNEITNIILKDLAKKTAERIKEIEADLRKRIIDKKIVNKIISSIYKPPRHSSNNISIGRDTIYVIKIVLMNEDCVNIGDKFSNRAANKGVCSVIIPDHLMPKDEFGNPFDVLISPFAIPSRMNVNQIYELYISKLVYFCERMFLNEFDYPEELIPEEYKSDPSKYVTRILPLNIINDIIEKFSIETKNLQKEYIRILKTSDDDFYEFLEDVKKNGLHIIVDQFKSKDVDKDDIIEIYQKYHLNFNGKASMNPKKIYEYITGETNEYLEDEEFIHDNVAWGFLYVLYQEHIASHKINARSIGRYKGVTKTPTRGRSKGGGSHSGNDEINVMITFNAKNILKELTTIKSDDHAGKKVFFEKLSKGDFNVKLNELPSKPITKLTIRSYLRMLLLDLSMERNNA